MRERSARGRERWTLALLVAVFVASRLLWLATAPATASYWEESYRWLAVHEILTAPSQPLLEYQADHYQGGSLVMIALCLPFMALLGESLATLKLGALAVSTAILVLLVLASRRAFGRPVANLVGAAYVLGPPLLAYRGLVVMGSHWESLLFSLGQIWILQDLLAGRGRRPGRFAAFGLLAGLGVWFCYTAGLTTLACVVCWLLLAGRPAPRELAAAAAGAVAGLLPWGLYNAAHGMAGVTRILELFGGGDPIDHWTQVGPASKLWALASHDLPAGLVTPFPTALPGAIATMLTAGFAIPFALGVGASFARASRLLRWRFSGRPLPDGSDPEALRAELVFPLYALVFLVAFLASAFSVEPRYGAWAYRLFTPLAALMLVPAAVTAIGAARRGGWRRAAALPACAIALASSLVASTALALRRPDVMQHPNPLIGYMSMGVLLHRKYEGDLVHALVAARRVADPASRLRVFQGMGWGLEHRFEGPADLAELARVLDAIPLPDRAGVVLGLRQTAERRLSVVEALAQEDPSDANRRLHAGLQKLARFAVAQWQALPPALREMAARVEHL